MGRKSIHKTPMTARERKRRSRQRQKLNPGDLFADVSGDLVRALCEWAESKLEVPTGPLQGQPFRIDPWQREFLADALGPGVREAGLSVARKNGKTGLVALVCLGYLVGPLNRPQWRGLVTSLTGELAKELRHAIELTAATGPLPVDVRRSPTPGHVLGLNGSRLDFLAADKATGHAVGCDLAIIDEAGLMPEQKRDLWNAVLASVSGRDGRLLCISIQGSGPMFSGIRDRRGDPSVVWHEYAAAAGCALDDPESWHAANPGLASGIKSERYMADAARRALHSPSDQRAFRALDLNAPVDPGKEPICAVTDYQACIVPELPERTGRVYVGIDIGGSASMTALAAFWPASGRFECWGAFPDTPDLAERGLGDGVGNRYLVMRDRGEIRTYPGRDTPARAFLRDCADRLRGSRIGGAGADRYRKAEVLQVLSDAGLAWPIVWRGTGASAKADGSADVRAFQRAVLRRSVAWRESLLLASAIQESDIRFDPAGNPAIDKARKLGRIDALQAAVIAAGLAETAPARPTWRYRGAV